MTDLAAKIKEIEDSRQKANEKLRATRELVSGIRERRERVSADKADLDEKLNFVTKAFEAKKDAMQRHKSNFVVSSEEALDQQVDFFFFIHEIIGNNNSFIADQAVAARAPEKPLQADWREKTCTWHWQVEPIEESHKGIQISEGSITWLIWFNAALNHIFL